MLSNKIVTHKVIVKNSDWNGTTKYPLTQDMYATYRLAKADRKQGSMVWLTDIDWNRLREIDPIEFKEFEEFEEIKVNNELVNKYWICSKLWKHPINWFPDNCECNK